MIPCDPGAEAEEGALSRWEILLVPVEMMGVFVVVAVVVDDGDPPFVVGCAGAGVETVRPKVPIMGAA